jgi:DNA-binding transcriptional MerR regulator
MNNTYSIGQIGKIVGLPPKTIRYYEEMNLITSTKRESNGYRVYTDESKEELTVLKYARDLGLPIDTMKKLINGCVNNKCEHSKEEVEQEVNDYIMLLEEKIKQMSVLRDKLKKLRNTIQVQDLCNDTLYCCNILHQLSTVKGGEAK